MKISIPIIFVSLSLSLNAVAQFNTVSHYRLRIQVNSITANSKAGNDDNIQQMASTHYRADTIDKKKEWTDRYMSVSYPLQDIDITSDYGSRKDPFTGKRSWHSGLNLRASQGSEVYAMMFGQVINVDSDKHSGKYVTLRHGDFTVSYCHLSEPLVKKGQIVAAGEPVGLTGSIGRSTGPHLHLTLKRGHKRLHPRIILDYISNIRAEAIHGFYAAYDGKASKSQQK